MTDIKELESYGYEQVSETKTNVVLTRNQYLDNGYGYYFTSEIEIIFNKKKQEITKIKVDDYTEKQIGKLLTKEISRCSCMKKYKECIESILLTEKQEQKLNLDCNECTYLTMIDSLMQCLNDGNW